MPRPATIAVKAAWGHLREQVNVARTVWAMDAPQPALASDAARLLVLRDQAARWLTDRGIEQWVPGEVSLQEVQMQVAAGEWFVLRRDGDVVAGLRLLLSDEVVWGTTTPDAIYVHGLVVDRRFAGEGLGVHLLDWAEMQAHDRNRAFLRLDCADTNPLLRAFYIKAGFTEVGRREFTERPWHPVVLMEKRLVQRRLRVV